jgi:8-oxo-dGTP pyrophosphatase MutT (NUDIX family)
MEELSSSRSDIKDLLLEDYRYRAEALKSSEQSGETRFNIFIGLVTLVAGALVALGTAEFSPKGNTLRIIILGALIVLLVVGWMTLMRLLIRNKRTDECKRNLDHIRQLFKDHFDEDGMLVGYYPVNRPRFKANDQKDDLDLNKASSSDRSWRALLKEESDRGFGGMAHLMVAVNSLLLAALAFCLVWLPGDMATVEIDSAPMVAAVTAAGLLFIVGFVLQLLFVIRREESMKAELRLSERTHAGGVVYKTENGNVCYLVIPPKDRKKNIWVLPKGHIRKGEGHGEAALREVEEETGVVARLVCPLGEVSFRAMRSAAQEEVRAKFYLMEWLFDAPGERREDRALQWLPFEQALEKLTFPEGKRMLLMAHARQRDMDAAACCIVHRTATVDSTTRGEHDKSERKHRDYRPEEPIDSAERAHPAS